MKDNVKKFKNTTIRVPLKLMGKIEFISEKTLLSKGRVILMAAQASLDAWCQGLMDDEIAAVNRKIKGNPVSYPGSLPKGPVV